jgi:hypothetical protein
VHSGDVRHEVPDRPARARRDPRVEPGALGAGGQQLAVEPQLREMVAGLHAWIVAAGTDGLAPLDGRPAAA